MDIYEIKEKLQGAPHFFDESTMRFFHQTLEDFEVWQIPDHPHHFAIQAPMKDFEGKVVGTTFRIFDDVSNTFLAR
jgi:hypothetical protein